MPAGTTPVALDVDGAPCRWMQAEKGLDVSLVPSALPFRLTLSYRGKLSADEGGQDLARTTIALDSPTIGDQASRGEAWIVAASPAAPWSIVDEEKPAGTLDYVEARLVAFDTTFAATPRTGTCTSDELRTYAVRRLRDLAGLRSRTLLTPASDRRDALLARIETAAMPFVSLEEIARDDSGAAPAASIADDATASPAESGAKPLILRVGQDGTLSRIEFAVESPSESVPFPWRRVAETSAIVLICLATARFGSRLLKWFEHMPLQAGSLVLVLLAPLFVPSGWIVPAIVIGFLALVAVATRRWVLPLLPHRPRAARTS
jgi:hypothetical protein